MNKIEVGKILQEQAYVPLDDPMDQYDKHMDILSFLSRIYIKGDLRHIDVAYELIKEYPNNMVYDEAVALVSIFDDIYDKYLEVIK